MVLDLFIIGLAMPWATVFALKLLEAIGQGAMNPPRHYPKGHVHEYDPDGIYTYKHQNPRFEGVDTPALT